MDKDDATIRSAVIRLVQALNAIYEENSIVVHRKQPNPVKFSLEELVIADFSNCLGKSSHVMCSRFQTSTERFTNLGKLKLQMVVWF